MPAQDVTGSGVGFMASGVHAAAITPSDSTDLTIVTRGLYVGGAGDVTVILQGGETVTFSAMMAGIVHALRVTRVKATGTTATNLVAVW